MKDYFEESSRVIKELVNYVDVIQKMAAGIYENQLKGGKLLIAGNGGSCSDAEHFACELTCTFQSKRGGFCAINLAASPSAIMAWSNDFGFEEYFARQVQALGKEGDILFLISTGGGLKDASWNLVKAADWARIVGLKIYSLVGKTGGELSKISDLCLIVPSFDTAHIQECHITIIHAICMEIDRMVERDNQTGRFAVLKSSGQPRHYR